LFSQLVQQYLFISLYQAMAASLAAENASRLAATQSAERNIRDRLEDLTSQYRQQRQSAITAELLDVVSGFEALTGE
jgi:F-type H+-transporting ATPase subunit gamma